MMLMSELETIIHSLKGNDALNMSVMAMQVIYGVVKQVKDYVLTNGFADINEEIVFFKELKPLLHSKLIYYMEIKEIESKRILYANKEFVRAYLIEQVERLTGYLEENIYTYKYLQLGSTFLDEALFTRKNVLEFSCVDRDNLDDSFMTLWDNKVSRILAYQMLLEYLNSEILLLDKPFSKSSKLVWHGTKRGLVELIYALVTKECFGEATIKDLADFFQLNFNVDLGDYSGIYKELKERPVKNRAGFLGDLVDGLLKRMEEDENS